MFGVPQVRATASSARPPTFAWSCSNDAELNAFLGTNSGPNLVLPAGTPQLAIPGPAPSTLPHGFIFIIIMFLIIIIVVIVRVVVLVVVVVNFYHHHHHHQILILFRNMWKMIACQAFIRGRWRACVRVRASIHDILMVTVLIRLIFR